MRVEVANVLWALGHAGAADTRVWAEALRFVDVTRCTAQHLANITSARLLPPQIFYGFWCSKSVHRGHRKTVLGPFKQVWFFSRLFSTFQP